MLDVKKYTLLTFKGICMNFLLELKKYLLANYFYHYLEVYFFLSTQVGKFLEIEYQFLFNAVLFLSS